MQPAALMLQGTGSDVGKSLLVAGLCRAYARRGLRVRPFKPQNMSNNAAIAVAADGNGGEIGRAQALQARACGVAPSVDMNPVLLKPQTDVGAQVVVQGRVRGNTGARDYQALKATLLPTVLESYRRLARQADIVLVEGAGSPAEVNLRRGDIANMGFATAAGVPVVLVGDIDRGGVIAQLVGTWELLDAADRRLLRGYLVNKFRGDASLFDDGLAAIAARTGLPSFGVVPYFADARRLPAEDAVQLDNRDSRGGGPVRISVLRLPRIANFDDFDPLAAEPCVTLGFIEPGEAIPGDSDLVIVPGSKATLADLKFLRAQGWDIDLLAHRRRGGAVLGICGGYQMLGRAVRDPQGIEGRSGEAPGLALLDVETVMEGDKTLSLCRGRAAESGAPVEGYRMHMGRTSGSDLLRPLLVLDDGADGAVSRDGRVMGCYLHGLFASDPFRRRFLAGLGADSGTRGGNGIDYWRMVDDTLDGLADHLETHTDVDGLLALARGREIRRTA